MKLTDKLKNWLRAARGREAAWNATTSGVHETGRISRSAEVAFASRHLLCQQGTAAGQVKLNVAATRPIGPVVDEAAIGDDVAVAVLGCANGTLLLTAVKAITAGAPVYTAAGGKVTDAYAATSYIVGRALTAAAADGDLIEVAHCFPMVNATATL